MTCLAGALLARVLGFREMSEVCQVVLPLRKGLAGDVYAFHFSGIKVLYWAILTRNKYVGCGPPPILTCNCIDYNTKTCHLPRY